MKSKGHPHCPGGHFTRRDLIRVGGLTFLGINLPQYLQLKQLTAATEDRSPASAEACILLFLSGGPGQMDTWDPKPNSSFKAISTSVPGIQISELLPQVAKQMDKLAIIRSMHSKENDHREGVHYALTGHSPSPVMKFPSLGSIVTKEKGARHHVPPHIMVPQMSHHYRDIFKGHIISPAYDPMFVPDPHPDTAGAGEKKEFSLPDLSLPASLSAQRIENRRALRTIVDRKYRQQVAAAEFSEMDAFTEQAWNLISSPAVRQAFDLSQEPQKIKESYGLDSFGQSALLARRLVEAGSRFVTAVSDGWDTHGTNDKFMREKLTPSLDRTLSTLLEDLDQRGLLDSTVIIVTGEFGRTPDFNFELGRDHWPECWSVALAGGGIRGGQVVGASDERAAFVAERTVTIGDLFATIYKALGVDWHKEYMHPIGRPVKIANAIDDMTGTPLKELI